MKQVELVLHTDSLSIDFAGIQIPLHQSRLGGRLFCPDTPLFTRHRLLLAFRTVFLYHVATVVQEVKKSVSNQKVASSIPCRSVLEQDTEPIIAPDVQCAISVNVKCKMCIHCKSHICKSLWIKASAK